MPQSIWRPLLILALLLPLSRLSFGDDTFAVSGFFEDFTGGGAFGNIFLPSSDVYGGGPWDWEENLPWTVGSVESAEIYGDVAGGSWSFDGFTGLSSETFRTNGFSFNVEDGGITGIPITWTGELDLYDDTFTTLLFEISMSGSGTASISGGVSNGLFYPGGGEADVTGVGQVIYEDPSVPEPSTLTLMSIAGLASILAMQFRRRKATQN